MSGTLRAAHTEYGWLSLFRRAFGWCVPIGALAGLVGLGGGKFRLPVLIQFGRLRPQGSNSGQSFGKLVTLAFALAVRGTSLSLADVLPHSPEVLGLACGGMLAAFHGASLVQALTSERLVQVIAVLLIAIGALLCVEALFPFSGHAIISEDTGVRLLTGCGIGLVSSLLGVAGGELLIPTLIFIFRADIRTAGSASILISLCLISVVLWRYWRIGAFPKGRGAQRISAAMGIGVHPWSHLWRFGFSSRSGWSAKAGARKRLDSSGRKTLLARPSN